MPIFVKIMSIHFRRIIAIVVNEYLAQTLNKNANDVHMTDLKFCLTSIRKTSGAVAIIIRDILLILCGSTNVDAAAENTIAMWLRRRQPLIAVNILIIIILILQIDALF